jgi:hypothetical protein
LVVTNAHNRRRHLGNAGAAVPLKPEQRDVIAEGRCEIDGPSVFGEFAAPSGDAPLPENREKFAAKRKIARPIDDKPNHIKWLLARHSTPAAGKRQPLLREKAGRICVGM